MSNPNLPVSIPQAEAALWAWLLSVLTAQSFDELWGEGLAAEYDVHRAPVAARVRMTRATEKVTLAIEAKQAAACVLAMAAPPLPVANDDGTLPAGWVRVHGASSNVYHLTVRPDGERVPTAFCGAHGAVRGWFTPVPVSDADPPVWRLSPVVPPAARKGYPDRRLRLCPRCARYLTAAAPLLPRCAECNEPFEDGEARHPSDRILGAPLVHEECS